MGKKAAWWLIFVVSLWFVLPMHGGEADVCRPKPGYHWLVNSKDGLRSYGIAGDSSVTFLWYGPGCFVVPAPFYAVVGLIATIPMGWGFLARRISRKDRYLKKG